MNSLTEALISITQRPEQIMVRGQGSWLYDDSGRAYLDFVQGWAVNALGHCHPAVVEAINQQASQLLNAGPAFHNRPMLALAQQLTRASGLEQVFFTGSGAEANESAIKLARKWGSRHRGGAFEIITMENGFHGRTLATMSATGKAHFADLYEPKVPGFPKVPYNNLPALAAAITPNTVAVMLELVQGEAGVLPADADYLLGMEALCRQQGLLLIIDEVQTGMGRCGTLFAFQHYGIKPDIVTLGKGLGGGVPISAQLARRDICCFEPGDQGGTFSGNPLTTAAAGAVLAQLLAPGFLDEVQARAGQLTNGLENMAKRFGLPGRRGLGLLQALQLSAPVAEPICARAFERGLLINAARPDVLRFMPALTVSADEIAQMLAILEALLAEHA